MATGQVQVGTHATPLHAYSIMYLRPRSHGKLRRQEYAHRDRTVGVKFSFCESDLELKPAACAVGRLAVCSVQTRDSRELSSLQAGHRHHRRLLGDEQVTDLCAHTSLCLCLRRQPPGLMWRVGMRRVAA